MIQNSKQQRIHHRETTATDTRSRNKDCKQRNRPGFNQNWQTHKGRSNHWCEFTKR